MRVFHDAEGRILYTLIGDGQVGPGAPAHVVVPDGIDLGEISDWRVQGGALVRASLAGLKARAEDEVNAAVGAARATHLTALPGQEMLYLEKRAEAAAYAALDPAPATLDDFPLIAAEIGITGADAWQVAQVWLNRAALLTTVAAGLENLRLGATAAIAAATDEAAIAAALGAFDAALAASAPP